MSPDLPILDTTYRGKQADKDWTFVKLLRQDYNIYEISGNTPQIPLDINTLIVVSTRKFSSVGLYAIDQFLLRGGNLLVMVDPFSEYEDKLKGITEIEGSDLNLLLKTGVSAMKKAWFPEIAAFRKKLRFRRFCPQILSLDKPRCRTSQPGRAGYPKPDRHQLQNPRQPEADTG